MKKTAILVASAIGLATASPALAQDTGPAAEAAPSTSYSDADVQAYAAVAAELNRIQADTALSETDKQNQMVAAVQNSGLDVDRFNAITEASRTDPELRQKLQEATPPAQ